jgi:mannosyltransferase OCH1-like enzyme
MIQKIIHYCWLSGEEYPNSISECINSWKYYLADYRFILWDANNFDINSVQYVMDAYCKKKYAFAADFIRFYVLYNYGGIYLDSDVKVIKSFDDLLNNKCFIGLDFEDSFEAAIIGSEKGAGWMKDILNYFYTRKFYINDKMDLTPIPLIIKKILSNTYNINLSTITDKTIQSDITFYSYRYFSPKNPYSRKYKIYSETYSIHDFKGSWLDVNTMVRIKIIIHFLLIKIFGRTMHNKIIKIARRLRRNNLFKNIGDNVI